MFKKYHVNEIFYSIQGEGVRAGSPNIFVRFQGCNLRCDVAPGLVSPGGFACDTEFVSGREMTAVDILSECRNLTLSCRNIIFTGGEPGLQIDEELLTVFEKENYFQAAETNGTVDLTKLYAFGLNWITLSPKIAEHAIKCFQANEIKYVRGYGQEVPRPAATAIHKLISPAFEGNQVDKRTLEWCVSLVKNNPTWQLSIQQHKFWGVR